MENPEDIKEKSKAIAEDNFQNNSESEENETQTSSLTDWDLRCKLNEACRAKVNKWTWVTFIFPAEFTCLCEYDGRPTELDYLKFDYSVEGDEVAVGEPINVKLVVSVADVNNAIAERDDALVKANDMIKALQSEVDKLQPLKEAFEKAERERIESEIQSKREVLSTYAQKSGFITKEEIEDSGSDIYKMISELNEDGIKNVIATRFMDSLNNNMDSTETHVEVASVKDKPAEVSAILDSDDDVISASIVKIFLNKKEK